MPGPRHPGRRTRLQAGPAVALALRVGAALRVVEASGEVATRYCGRLLAQLGASVTQVGDTIDVAPTNPEVVYVPYYDPWLVYGPWPWIDYPPFYFTYPPGIFVPGFKRSRIMLSIAAYSMPTRSKLRSRPRMILDRRDGCYGIRETSIRITASHHDGQ